MRLRATVCANLAWGVCDSPHVIRRMLTEDQHALDDPLFAHGIADRLRRARAQFWSADWWTVSGPQACARTSSQARSVATALTRVALCLNQNPAVQLWDSTSCVRSASCWIVLMGTFSAPMLISHSHA